MFDRLLLFSCLVALVFAGDIELLKKCCPKGQTLAVKELNQYKIECVTISELDSIHGYNLETNTTAYNATCEWQSRFYSGQMESISLTGCVELVGSNLIGIDCKTKIKPLVEIMQMQKCCPEGHKYDLDTRKCVCTPNAIDSFRNLFGNITAVVFTTGVPRCTDDEAFVEYHSNDHSIWPINGQVEIALKTGNEILPSKKFCIDESWQSKHDELTMPQDTYSFIIRSCRPKTVCDSMPCIRRCCRSDQMLEQRPGDNRSECYDHPERKNFVPWFYNLENGLTTDTPERKILKGKVNDFNLVI